MQKPDYLKKLDFKREHWEVINIAKDIGEDNFHLWMLGYDLAKEHGWAQVKYLQAVHLHVLQKHNWPLAEIRSLSTEDLLFVLTDELQTHSSDDQQALSRSLRLGWNAVLALGNEG